MTTVTSKLYHSSFLSREKEVNYIYTRYSANLLDHSQTKAKRALDVIFASLFLVFVGSWLFILIAICIRLESKGPVFYKQLRHGQNNVPFYCLKFRSMVAHSGQFRQATQNDSRITKVGKILRRTSLDEFPQLLNVLMGDMSLVGPRPHVMVMNSDYSARIENFMYRHLVKPGITGLAQAKGFRGEIRNNFDINSRFKYDLFYIKNWSLLFDLRIMFLTVICLLKNNKNAY